MGLFNPATDIPIPSTDWRYLVRTNQVRTGPTWDNLGYSHTFFGTITSVTPSGGLPFLANAASTTTLGNSAHASGITLLPFNKELSMKYWVKLGEVTGNRLYVGWTELSMGNPWDQSDTPSTGGNEFCGFRFTGGTDTNFKIITSNGAATTTSDSGVAVNTTSLFVLEFNMRTNGNIDFYINGTRVVSNVSATLPSSATVGLLDGGVVNTVGGAGSARNVQFCRMVTTQKVLG